MFTSVEFSQPSQQQYAYGDDQQLQWTHIFASHVWRSCIRLCGNVHHIKQGILQHAGLSPVATRWCDVWREDGGKLASIHQRRTWLLAPSFVLMFMLYSLSLWGTLSLIMEEKVLPFYNVFLWYKELHCALNKYGSMTEFGESLEMHMSCVMCDALCIDYLLLTQWHSKWKSSIIYMTSKQCDSLRFHVGLTIMAY